MSVASDRRRIVLPGRALPVLYDVDVTVVGGTLAGTAAAVTLARAGRRVLLVERDLALGTDLTAANRPWLSAPPDGEPLPELLRALLAEHRWHGTRLPLRPAALKLCLENALLSTGGAVLYGTAPLAVHHRAGRVRGLVLANKSGRQLARCPTLLDATGADPVLRRAGGWPEPAVDSGERVWSVEFDGVSVDAGTAAEHPAARSLQLYDGYRGPGHLHALFSVAGGRRAAVRAAGRLCRAHPAFTRAQLGAVGTEPLAGPPAADGPGEPAVGSVDGLWRVERPRPLSGVHAEPLDPVDAVRRGAALGVRLTGAASEAGGPAGPGPARTAPRVPAADPWSAERPLTGPVGTGPRSEAAGTPTASVAPQTPLVAGPASVAPDAVARAVDAGSAGSASAFRTRAATGPGGAPASTDPPAAAGDPVVSDVAAAGAASRVTVAEQDAPQRGRWYPRESVDALPVPCHDPVDVLVVGGGTSGASAALAAAREGARTLLLESAPGPGGTGTYGGVHSYWFGRREGHAAEIQRETRRVHRRLGLQGGVGRWNIEAKALALDEALRAAGVRTLYGVRVCAALRDADRVTGAVFLGPDGPAAATARVVVDATGDADLAAWSGAPCGYGAAGTHTVMWSSLAQFDTPATTRNSFGGLADVTHVQDTTRAVLAARRRGADMHDHGFQPAARESRHLLAEVVVTLTDQLTGRHWPDVVNLHFSNHDLKGKGEALWPQLGLVPPNLEIELPYRALLPRGLDGLLVTGKALGATHDALPALRMQADLENLGEVTGLAAARCAATGLAPRELDVPALQDLLVRRGRLPATLLRRDAAAPGPPDVSPTVAAPRALIAELTEHLPLHSYSDMGRREVFRGGIPFVRLALDLAPTVTSALSRALAEATEPASRVVLAQLLTLRGRPEGSEVLLRHLADRFAGDRLPVRGSRIREAQLPPDQSAMPDEAYLLHTLAFAREPRAVSLWERVALLLDAGEQTFRDPWVGTFAWVDAVCAGAERLGDPAAVAALERLHARPTLCRQWRTTGIEPDDVQERRAVLELALGRALAACGSPRGYQVLIRYLDDNRALLAEQAHSRLSALTGVDLGKDGPAWRRHLAAVGAPAPTPLPLAHDPHLADLPPSLIRVGDLRQGVPR